MSIYTKFLNNFDYDIRKNKRCKMDRPKVYI